MKRVPFPRYISNSRLFYIFEADEVIVAITVMFTSGGILGLIIGVPLFLTVLITAFLVYFTVKFYIKYTKKVAPGFLKHKLYDLGFLKPSQEDFIPYGFEREFKD